VSDQDPFIHPKAINESSSIGAGTQIWAFAHVMEGAVVGRNVNVGDHAFVESGAKVGDNVTIKNAVLIWDGVTIENDCFIGPRATFTNDKLPRSPRMESAPERYQQREAWIAETVVQAGSSIGAAATIGPGVTLGRGCMVGAGATVLHNVPPYALVVGTPAKHVGDVCRCGQRLSGDYDAVDCDICGQTAEARRQTVVALSHPT
jgi:acetyltransferase-like isoleucine patch superfamily enzyme